MPNIQVKQIPFQFPDDMDAIFALYDHEMVSYRHFWQHVFHYRSQLPNQRYILNYCEDRYLFCVALFSAFLNGSITLLPPSKSPGIIEELVREYGTLSAITDQPLSNIPIDQQFIHLNTLERASQTILNQTLIANALNAQKTMLIAFTSGSTGVPKPQQKTWGSFVDCAQRATHCLKLTNQPYAMLSTTPPQHMFGLETSVFWPYVSNLILINNRPFYPEDIRQAIQSLPYPVILCSTPSHLRACVSTPGVWSNLAGVISSTAPMPNQLAADIETIMGVELYELYGSTETLSYASRRPRHQEEWTPYADVVLTQHSNKTKISATFLQKPVALDDVFDIQKNGDFKLIGRAADLVKVAGKRSSIADLNIRLQAIPGIIDGCFFRIQRTETNQRLGIVVVSNHKPETIIQHLKRHLDEVFLPRVIYYSEKIPRNGVGKIVDIELKKLIDTFRGSQQ